MGGVEAFAPLRDLNKSPKAWRAFETRLEKLGLLALPPPELVEGQGKASKPQPIRINLSQRHFIPHDVCDADGWLSG